MADDIQFEVGGKYENMKGVFEVIAMRGDSMDIRWENGEEISTPIELQQRIIERMQFEKELERADARQQALKVKGGAKAKQPFTGLELHDFNSSVSKTTWRGRGQLGGAVARHLQTKRFKFNSWAVLRKAEVNWLDMRRQKQDDLPLQAKFFARIANDCLCYGLHIPVSDAAVSTGTDWHRFADWLAKPENDAWLNEQFHSNDLCLCDADGRGFDGVWTVREGRWQSAHAVRKEKSVESLHAFLTGAAAKSALDLRMERRIPKTDVLERKQRIADDLVALFLSLMPVYAAVASPNA